MSSYDEPTQQVRRPQPPPAPLPGSLDPLRGHRADPDRAPDVVPDEVETGTGWVDTHPTDEPAPAAAAPAAAAADAPPTGVLSLDEIFEAPEPQRGPTVTADAPTWTAMPVVPVRSEPVTAGAPGAWATQLPYDAAPDQRSSRAERPGFDAAWARTRLQVESWLRRDDNGLMLLTAVVACLLMIVVAGVGG